MSVGIARLSLTLSSFFSCSRLYNNALTGTIPPQISTLTKLDYLYAPKWHIHWVLVRCFIDCWSCAPLSQPFKFFFAIGTSTTMPWRAQSRLKYQRWPTSQPCMPQVWSKLLCVGHGFIECWPCGSLPHLFKRPAFFCLQESQWQRLKNHGHNPSADICPSQAGGTVSPHFFLFSVVQSISAF